MKFFPVVEFILLPSESKENFLKEKGCHVLRKTGLDEVGEVDNGIKKHNLQLAKSR